MTYSEHTVRWTVQISTQNTAESFGQFGQIVDSFLRAKWLVVCSACIWDSFVPHFKVSSKIYLPIYLYTFFIQNLHLKMSGCEFFIKLLLHNIYLEHLF